ncbi:MAG: cellulase family glycosylhydrolase [Eubacteriales bacterium]|nr:cellulase family glycosylhydrolase [Eubacteriales bacterium]
MQEAFSTQRVKGFLHTDGTRMVNGDEEEVVLRGWGMGNWTNPEGFMVGGASGFRFSGQYDRAQPFDRARSMKRTIEELCGAEYAKSFWPRWYRNYLGEADIAAVAAAGYNSVRLPLCHWAFLPEEPGIRFNEDSFAMLGDVLDWCEKYRLYAVLDLHAAAGGQSALPCDDGRDNTPHLFTEPESWERTIVLWEEIARRYSDRWIVGAYELLNEPLSLPQWDHLLPKLAEFYDACIARIRAIDQNHMLSLEGHRFSSRIDLFTRDFDPLCHNWSIQTHCYRAIPDPAMLQEYAACAQARQVPLWMGETNGYLTWMTSFFQFETEIHMGFNMWCWKVANDTNSGAVYALPQGWEEIRAYIERGDKPTYARAQAIFDELLENVKYENCAHPSDERDRYVLRQPGCTVPAVAYDSQPGRGSSFFGEYALGNPFGYRLADGMKIVPEPGYIPTEKPSMAFAGQPQGEPKDDFQHMLLELRPGEYACYTLRDICRPSRVDLEYCCEQRCAVRLSCRGETVWEGEVPLSAGVSRFAAGSMPVCDCAVLKIECLSGQIGLKNICFGR